MKLAVYYEHADNRFFANATHLFQNDFKDKIDTGTVTQSFAGARMGRIRLLRT